MSRLADVLADAVAAEVLREGGTAVAGAVPAATVTPTSVDEVSTVLEVASAAGFGVVPVGGATDLGPRAPSEPFVVLSTRGLAGVETYEPADLTMSAGAGTTLAELGDVTAPHAQWLPFDPPFLPARTLGGLAATGVRAPLCASYGALRDHVLGLTLVTGDGRVLRLGGRVMKNVAGFDLVKLAVGSRGTLGVVTSVTVRLFPRPQREVGLVLDAARAEDLVPAARSVATAPVLPASAVLMTGARTPTGGGAATVGDDALPEAALVVRVAGAPETVAADAAKLRAHAGCNFRLAEGEEAASLFEALRDHGSTGDVVVRVSALPASLPDVLAGIASVGCGARMTVDVMAGLIRIAGDTDALSGDTLAELRDIAEASGASCVLERGPAEILTVLAGAAAETRVGTLTAALKARFDPRDVLWRGKTP